MPRRVPIFLALLPLIGTAWAEGPNLTETVAAGPGAVAQLVTAQRGFEVALKSGEPVLLLASIRLARMVVLRAPTAWERVTDGEAPQDQPKGKDAAPDPASSTAVAIIQNFAGDDPMLADYVYDLDAQLPRSRRETAIAADAILGAGQVDHWRMPLSGSVPAEIGVIGDGDTALSLTIVDEAGLPVCTLPASADPLLCGFVPARNGFFSVTITNTGGIENTYRLLGS